MVPLPLTHNLGKPGQTCGARHNQRDGNVETMSRPRCIGRLVLMWQTLVLPGTPLSVGLCCWLCSHDTALNPLCPAVKLTLPLGQLSCTKCAAYYSKSRQ
ncbi:hypothetical protein NP493_546g04064 [Ridgeia piscesae]|uniref:Uncharacterized protein n=1 Tax=Ridgeia piscesae TaxID=27915 RepID=A0AAD9KVP1_RIDPI|nr:hypothetical protein NP493_546g04064 [Ridgeia piscesae]